MQSQDLSMNTFIYYIFICFRKLCLLEAQFLDKSLSSCAPEEVFIAGGFLYLVMSSSIWFSNIANVGST
jgi:hypothetical protein